MNSLNSKTPTVKLSTIDESSAMIRLTALWALSEAGLGGILHLFRTPFAGLLVGGIAVMIISIMSYISDKPFQTIPKALVLVLIVKMTISPHSPLPAYFAVAFQGILGAFLFTMIPSHRLACIALGFLGLMESALQKLITLTLIFGKSIWDSIDIFIDHVLKQLEWISQTETYNGSLFLVICYVSCYGLGGILIGLYASFLPKDIENAMPLIHDLNQKLEPIHISRKQEKKSSFFKSYKFKLVVLVIVVICVLYAFLPDSRTVLDPFWIIMRVAIILLVWFLVVGPFLFKMFQKFLNKKSSQYQDEINQAMSMLPVFRHLIIVAWESTHDLKGYQKIKNLGIRILGLALIYKNEE